MSIAAATHRFFMDPSLQRFTPPITVLATEIIDSMQLVFVSVDARRPDTPSRRTVNISSRPSRRDAAASGSIAFQLRCDGRGPGEALLGVRVVEAPGKTAIDPPCGLLGQVPGDVAALVQGAALHEGLIAEDLADPGRERLGAVDHHQQAARDLQAPGHEVAQQVGHDRGVLGVAQVQPHRDLLAVGGNHQGCHQARACDLDPVDHHHRDVEVRQVPSHQLGKGSLGGPAEPPGDRRARGARGARLDLPPDRLGHVAVPAGRDPGEHPFHDQGRKQVLVREHRPGVQGDLGAVGRAAPGTGRGDLAAAEHDLSGRGPVPVPLPVRDPGVLRADRPCELCLHHLEHHHQAGGRGEGQ